MAPTVDTANHKNSANVDTCEMRNRFNKPDRMMAAAWHETSGNSNRSNRSHGISCVLASGTNDARRANVPRRLLLIDACFCNRYNFDTRVNSLNSFFFKFRFEIISFSSDSFLDSSKAPYGLVMVFENTHCAFLGWILSFSPSIGLRNKAMI